MSLLFKIRQYGFKNSIKRLCKKILAYCGLQYESYFLMKNYLDKDTIGSQISLLDFSTVKKLDYEDFLKGDQSIFTVSKLERIKNRFQSENHWAYGIVKDDKLIYSCWFKTEELEYPTLFNYKSKLTETEGLLFDAYCHPMHRGKGYHTTMNLYRLNKMIEQGLTTSVTFINKDNTPSYRTQIHSGAVVEETIIFLKLFSKSFMIKEL